MITEKPKFFEDYINNGFEYLNDIKDEKLDYFLFKKVNKPKL